VVTRRGDFTALDLFSGAGGMSRGFEDAGFEVLGAVEIDELAAETYELNFPRARVWTRDVRRVSATEVMRELRLRPGELDLLGGCPPCQGFSTMTTLNGSRASDDRRNDLILRMTGFVRAMRPKVVLVENVPGLAKDGRISRFVSSLRMMGYHAQVTIVDAADYGVPQRRVRMLLIATRDGRPMRPPRRAPRRTVRDAIGRLPEAGVSGDPMHDHGEDRSIEVMDLIRQIPRDGGSRLDLPMSQQLDCHIACTGFKDVYGRMAWDDVAPTITSGCVNPSKGRFLHPDRDRSITLREAASLQTFPSSHRFSMRRGKFATASLIGNALPPRLVRSQARAIEAHLRGRR
jgi:DNA (cytosine-5)-methyltransferase 1